MRIRQHVLVAVLAIAAFSGASGANPPDVYAVSARLSDAGTTFATPSATVLADKPAVIAVSGPDGYKLTLTVTDLGADRIRVVAGLESPHGAMAPTVVLRPGQASKVSVGDLGLELTVRRSDRFAGSN